MAPYTAHGAYSACSAHGAYRAYSAHGTASVYGAFGAQRSVCSVFTAYTALQRIHVRRNRHINAYTRFAFAHGT